VCTSDRVILLFDEHGEKRDKFSLKPADSKVNMIMIKKYIHFINSFVVVLIERFKKYLKKGGRQHHYLKVCLSVFLIIKYALIKCYLFKLTLYHKYILGFEQHCRCVDLTWKDTN